MAAVIEKVISEAQKLLADLEKVVKAIIDKIGVYSHEVAGRLKIMVSAAFHKISKDISSMAQDFKAKLKALSTHRTAGHVGPAGSSFKDKIENAIRSAEKDTEKLINGFKESAKTFIEKAHGVISRIEADLAKTTEETLTTVRNAGHSLFTDFKTIGEDAYKKVESFSQNFIHHIEVEGSLVYKHDVQIAEAAAVAVVGIKLPLCLGLAAGMMAFAAHYEPH